MQAHEVYSESQCTGVALASRAGAEQIDLSQLQSGVFKEETTKKRGVGSDSCHREGGIMRQFMTSRKVIGYPRQT